MSKTKKLLEEALKVLDGGRAWCQGEYARTVKGTRISSTHELAAAFCAVGAMEVAHRRLINDDPLPRTLEWTDAFTALTVASGLSSVVNFNDTADSFYDIELMFKAAIASFEE